VTVIRIILIAITITCIPSLQGDISAQELVEEVYRDEYVQIHARVMEQDITAITLGQVLSLVIDINYDDSRVQLQEDGAALFTSAWTQSHGAYLLEHQTSLIRSSSRATTQRHNLYFFQILGCPDGVFSCKGNRHYQMPAFELQYHIIDKTDEKTDSRVAIFRPMPAIFTVTSTLESDEAGELHGFSEYFPTGAYPDPLVGRVQKELYSGLIASGVFLLLGGILMSPLSLFKRKKAVQKSRPRWELVFEQLQSGKFEQDEKFMDELRRCVVWYCTDELEVDPFYWVKHQEEVSGKQQKGTGEYAEFRTLFIELLHNPSGEGKALLERFKSLLKK